MNDEFIISRLKYDEYSTVIHCTPYVYQVLNEEKKLIYFGSNHVYDKKNTTIRELENIYDDFEPELLMVEGMPQVSDIAYMINMNSQSNEIVIKKYGEMGYIALRAFNGGTVISSPEPTLRDEINFISSYGYDFTDIILYYLLRYRYQWINQRMQDNFLKYINKAINFLENYSGHELESYDEYRRRLILDYDFDIEIIQSSDCEQLIDPINRSFFTGREFCKLNWISRYSSIKRDITVIDKICKSFKSYRKIMIVFGATHAYLHRKPLQDLGFVCLDM